MAPQWFELPGSFAVDAWFRPSRLFLGSTVEGAIISCLITDRPPPTRRLSLFPSNPTLPAAHRPCQTPCTPSHPAPPTRASTPSIRAAARAQHAQPRSLAPRARRRWAVAPARPMAGGFERPGERTVGAPRAGGAAGRRRFRFGTPERALGWLVVFARICADPPDSGFDSRCKGFGRGQPDGGVKAV